MGRKTNNGIWKESRIPNHQFQPNLLVIQSQYYSTNSKRKSNPLYLPWPVQVITLCKLKGKGVSLEIIIVPGISKGDPSGTKLCWCLSLVYTIVWYLHTTYTHLPCAWNNFWKTQQYLRQCKEPYTVYCLRHDEERDLRQRLLSIKGIPTIRDSGSPGKGKAQKDKGLAPKEVFRSFPRPSQLFSK